MGTGIQDMIQLCHDAGLPAPEFKIEDAFVVTIRRKRDSAFEKVGGQIGGQIIDTQKLILNLVSENCRISRKEMAERLKINESAITKTLK
jgi:predicted HTH transcriptional regulator